MLMDSPTSMSLSSLLSRSVRSWGAPAPMCEAQPESPKAVQLFLMDSVLLPFMSSEFCLLLGFRWDASSSIASLFDHSVCLIHHLWHWSGFPGSSIGKESACQCRRHGFDPWLGKIPWRRKWEPTPVFLPGKSHGQKSLVGYSPWGHKRVGHDLWTKPPPWHWSQTCILWLHILKHMWLELLNLLAHPLFYSSLMQSLGLSLSRLCDLLSSAEHWHMHPLTSQRPCRTRKVSAPVSRLEWDFLEA